MCKYVNNTNNMWRSENWEGATRLCPMGCLDAWELEAIASYHMGFLRIRWEIYWLVVSEKYKSQLGLLFSMYGKIKHGFWFSDCKDVQETVNVSKTTRIWSRSTFLRPMGADKPCDFFENRWLRKVYEFNTLLKLSVSLRLLFLLVLTHICLYLILNYIYDIIVYQYYYSDHYCYYFHLWFLWHICHMCIYIYMY